MKNGDISKAEDMYLKAKQATEVFHEDSTPLWENYPEWQTLRLSIFQNLSAAYKLLHKEKLAYELLKPSSKSIKSNLFLENPDLILSGLDLFFLDLARFSYKQMDYLETIFNSDISISFIRGILRNSNVLNNLQLKFKIMQKSFEEFFLKKNMILGFLLFLKGKSQSHLLQNLEGQMNLLQAYNIGRVYQGESDPLTIKYSNALRKINKTISILPNEAIVIDDFDDDSLYKEDLTSISSILDETNEHLNNLLKPQQRPRRSSVFKNQSATFFDRKIVKHCGCIDMEQAQMAKIDYDSQKILNKFRNCDHDCNHDHSHKSFDLDHGENTKENHNKNGENHHHHHGHGHGHDEENGDIFQSFCSSIINKSLMRKTKNRHLNNHDLKKIYMESEQNLRKMKFIVDDFSQKQKISHNTQKVNILYSPNHDKIYGETDKNKEFSTPNLIFFKEKKPSIFSFLTPKTPYTKRIPLSRPFSAKNSNFSTMKTAETSRNAYLSMDSEEIRLLEASKPKFQLFMSKRPFSSLNPKKIEGIIEEKPYRTSRNFQRKIMKTEDFIRNPQNIFSNTLKTAKSNEENLFNSPFLRKRPISRTFKIDPTSPCHNPLENFNKNANRSLKREKSSEFQQNYPRGNSLIYNKENQMELLQENFDELVENISEKSDNTRRESSIILKEQEIDKIHCIFDSFAEKIEEKKEKKEKNEKNEKIEKIEKGEKGEKSPKKEEFGEKTEEKLNKSILKRNFAEKLIKEVFKRILLEKLKKKPIENRPKTLKNLSESPIQIKDFSLFNDSFRGLNRTFDLKSLGFFCEEPISFKTREIITNREILWKIKALELSFYNKKSHKSEEIPLILKIYLCNSEEKNSVFMLFKHEIREISEEIRDFRLVNVILDEILKEKGLFIEKKNEISDENITDLKLFQKKISWFFSFYVFFRNKIIGKTPVFLKEFLIEKILRNQRNYRSFQQFIYETAIFVPKPRFQAFSFDFNDKTLKKTLNNLSSLFRDAPSPLSIKSFNDNFNKKLNIFRKSEEFTLNSQNFTDLFENHGKSLGNSFKIKGLENVFRRNYRKMTDSPGILKENIKGINEALKNYDTDAVEKKKKNTIKSFMREFDGNFIDNIVILCVVFKGEKGFQIIDFEITRKKRENMKNFFDFTEKEGFFKRISKNFEIKTRIFQRNTKENREIIGDLEGFVIKYLGNENFMRKIEHFFYHLTFRSQDLKEIAIKIQKEMSFLKENSEENARNTKEIKDKFFRKTPKKLPFFEKNRIFIKFPHKFLRITKETDQNYKAFIYQPFSRNTNTYISFKKPQILSKIQLFSHNLKAFRLIWDKFIVNKLTFLGKKPEIKELNHAKFLEKPLFFSQGNLRKKQIFTQFHIINLGKCYIIINYWVKNFEIFFIKFEFSPCFSKYKKYVFSLFSEEIARFFKQKIPFFSEIEEKISINLLINCQKLYFRTFYAERGFLYKEIRLLVNKNQYLKSRGVINGDFNRLCGKGLEIIGQFTMKIKGEMVLVTIRRNFLLEKVNILIYFNRSSRFFQCSVNRNEYGKLKEKSDFSIYEEKVMNIYWLFNDFFRSFGGKMWRKYK